MNSILLLRTCKPRKFKNPKFFAKKLYELEILRADDSPEEIAFFTEMFHELLTVFTRLLMKKYLTLAMVISLVRLLI